MRLIAGASGVLGSGFREALGLRRETWIRMDLPWGDASAVARQVAGYWQDAKARYPNEPTTLIWAAGTGTIGASAEKMFAETATLKAVVEALAVTGQSNPENCFLYASSAGALFGGHGSTVIDDQSRPRPITAYGREKLIQESLVKGLSERGVMRTMSCRFTNVFGLTSGSLRRKGLVTALVESALLRQPARIFVSPDTRRDYVFARDAANLALAETDAGSMTFGPASAIVREGSTMTVLDVVASVSRVLRRKIPVVFVESPERTSQPLALNFAPRTDVQARIRTNTFEAAIRAMIEVPGGSQSRGPWISTLAN